MDKNMVKLLQTQLLIWYALVQLSPDRALRDFHSRGDIWYPGRFVSPDHLPVLLITFMSRI